MSNLFKKITSAASALLIVLSIVSPVTGVMAAYSTLESANKLASLGVIVDNSANPANYRLGDSITRGEMAKVTMKLSEQDVSETCEGKFSDLVAADWACKYAEAGLANGYFAANPTFRPMDVVTKIEALKMVMQARGVAKSSNTDWMAAYVEAGVEAGILDAAFSDYNTVAQRGWIFQTAVNAIEGMSDEGDDLLGDLLGDLDDDTDTTDTGTGTDTDTDVTVSGGDVEISLNPASAANGTQIPNNGTIRFALVDLTAGDSDVSVNTVDIKSLGLAAVPTATRIWFEKDGRRISGKAAFSSDRTAVVSFAPAYTIKAGSTETVDLYVELDTLAGNDFQFSGEIASSTASNNLGQFITNALRTATYTVAPVTFDKGGAGTSYNQSTDLMELGRFTLQNNDVSSETRDLKFQSITLRQNGNGDLLDLSDLQLERNGVAVSTDVVISGKDATFVVADTIKDGATATYYVKAKIDSVQNNAGDSYQFTLRNTTDISIIEVLNGFRSSITRTTNDLNTYTVTGSDITFERDSTVELSRNYAKGTSDVVFLKGTIKTRSAITLEDPSLTFNITGTSSGINNFVDTVYLQIGSSTMTWSASSSTGVTGTATFLGLATVTDLANVKMYAKLKDNAPAGTLKFDDMRLTSFTTKEYVSNQNTVSSAVGTISAVSVSVDSTTLSVTRTDGLGNSKIAVGSKGVNVYGVSLAVSQGNPVSISNATYTITASGSYVNNVFATLWIDGTAVSTKTIQAGTVTFNNVTKTVSTTPVKMEVKIDLSDAYNTGDFAIKLSALDITDTLTSQTVALGTTPSSATFTIAQAKGTLSSSDSNPKKSLLLAGTKDVKLLAFRVKAENDNVKLRDLSFTGVNLDSVSNLRILTPTNAQIAATSNNATTVTFTNLNPADADKIVMDTTATYYLIADLNTNVNNVPVNVNLAVSGSNIKSSNGTTVAMIGANVLSNVHLVTENMAIVAKATNSSKLLTTSALRFTVTASGKDQVILNGANFSNLFAGYTTGSGKIVIYKDSVSTGNKLGETTAGSTSGAITFSANNTVDAGSTNTYIVAIEGIVIDGLSSTQDWSVSMTNVVVGAINASDYTNMGTLPITEVK